MERDRTFINRRDFLAGGAGTLALSNSLARSQSTQHESQSSISPLSSGSTGPFRPNWESLKAYQCPDWFRDAKFGIWAHWSPQCVPEQGDWYARGMYIQGSPQYDYHLSTIPISYTSTTTATGTSTPARLQEEN